MRVRDLMQRDVVTLEACVRSLGRLLEIADAKNTLPELPEAQ